MKNGRKDAMSLPFDYLGPPPESGPLPAFIYLSISAEESLHLEPYCQPATFASDDWLRVFSFTLPGHEEGRDKFQAIHTWAEEMRKGVDLLTPFIDSAAKSIEELIEKRIIDPDHLGIGGLSRGAFFAAHIAAKIPHIKHLVGFAPLTKLSSSKDFEGIDVHHFDLENLVEKLLHLHHLRFYISNRDTLVGTDHCYSFFRRLVEAANEKKLRSPKFELHITPAQGREGHGTLRETFQSGADYIREALRGG